MKVVTLALICALASPARAEPCPSSTVMRRGAVASCDGVLVPAARVAQCLTDHHELAGCRVRLAGEVEARRLAELERDRRIIIADRHARETTVRTETEKAAVAHETRAADVVEIADDLEALAMELDGTGK